MTTAHDVIVVGAGLAGAAATRVLRYAGLRVVVLDKGRGPGGRLSTRRVESGSFDHGAASLQATGKPFRQWLESHVADGLAAPWRGAWVGIPGMNALVAAALGDVDPCWQAQVASLHRAGDRWHARDAAGVGLAEATSLVLAVPAPQAKALLESAALPALAPMVEALGEARYSPCWAGLFVVDEQDRRAAADGAAPAGNVLGAMYRESDKPGRKADGQWTVHATAAWSQANLELEPAEAARELMASFLAATGLGAGQVQSATAHRWRYALPVRGAGAAAREGAEAFSLWLAGDAIGADPEGNVPPAERAWCSGEDAARRVLASLLREP